MSSKAIIIGGSGLIGNEVLQQLCASKHYNEIISITRRPLGIYDKKIREIVVHVDHLDSIEKEIDGDVIFSCLGTTRSKTPDSNEYQKIEKDYTLTIAKIGLRNQVRQFHYVSSLGANKSAKNAYLKLKGEVEDQLERLPFSAMHIYQPSYLTGQRSENRIDDQIMNPLMRLVDPLLFGSLAKYKSIPATFVAWAMINQSLKNNNGTFIYPSNIIRQLA